MGEPTADRTKLLERLNTLWRVAGAAPPDGARFRWFRFQVRRAVGRILLGPQQDFNSAVVQYLNALGLAIHTTLEHREALEARLETALARYEEVRVSIGLLHRSTQRLTQDVARLAGDGATGGRLLTAAEPPSAAIDSTAYVGFEDRFRGTPEEIRARFTTYMPLFSGRTDVLDVGCGRGEFLSLLRDAGLPARGIDVNRSMVQICREQGLDASEADGLGYLRAQAPESLGGLFAAQVVEHLEPPYLVRLLEAAFTALRPGAPIVLETINVACWAAFFSSYIRDITHVRPLHPDTLRYLLIAAGFQRVDIQYRAPYPETGRLKPVAQRQGLEDWTATLNANAEKINSLLFTSLDYAAIGYRP